MMNNNNNKYIQMEKKGKEASRFARKANDSSGGSSRTRYNMCALSAWLGFFFKKKLKNSPQHRSERKSEKELYTVKCIQQAKRTNEKEEETRNKRLYIASIS
jgi:hypothetical protein